MSKTKSKGEKYHVLSVVVIWIIFLAISVAISYFIYNAVTNSFFVYFWFIVLTPIVMLVVSAYILIKNKLFAIWGDILFLFAYISVIFIGTLLIKYLEGIPDGDLIMVGILFFFMLGSGILFILTHSIIKFIANKVVPISRPKQADLEENTVIFKITGDNIKSSFNSLVLILGTILDYNIGKKEEFKNEIFQLLTSQTNKSKFLFIATIDDILFITPFTSLIYEYQFKEYKVLKNVKDIITSLLKFNSIDLKKDKNADKQLSEYIKLFPKSSVKKYELGEIFPLIRLFSYAVIIVIVIVFICLFYGSILGFADYIISIGAMPIIMGTIIGGIILGTFGYFFKVLKTKFGKKRE